MIEEISNIKEHKINCVCVSQSEFINYINDHNYNENMFTPDGKINPEYNNFKNTGLIAQIFDDHFEEYYLSNKTIIDKYRPNAYDEITKIINCHNKNLGCSVYECPNCHGFIFVGHTCKSRFCSSCGYKYKLIRVENILETVYNCPHRQMVFTIDEELRPFFFFPFDKRIDILFEAVKKTIYSILNETYKITKKGKKNIHLKKNIHQDSLCFFILLVET